MAGSLIRSDDVSASDDPHDPGWPAAGERMKAVGDAGRLPIRLPGGGVVRVGTASWTDSTMTAAGVFYPPEARSAEERLRYYASRFPLVEVDATYYALPQEQMSQLWVERTPEHFVFDVKAHALMTGQPTETRRLPKSIREALPDAMREKSRLYGKDLSAELRDEVWDAFKRGIEPLRAGGRLGAVLLQFPRWVFPSHEAREQIREARERMGEVPIAVEFRHGSWFNEKNAERTLRFLTDNAIPYVMVTSRRGSRARCHQWSWSPPRPSRSCASTAGVRTPGRSGTSRPPNASATCTTRTSWRTGRPASRRWRTRRRRPTRS